jgi:hypothetical protein
VSDKSNQQKHKSQAQLQQQQHEVVEFVFSDGSRMSRCKTCSFGQGHYSESQTRLYTTKHHDTHVEVEPTDFEDVDVDAESRHLELLPEQTHPEAGQEDEERLVEVENSDGTVEVISARELEDRQEPDEVSVVMDGV